MASKTDTLWRIQVRANRKAKWKNLSGLYETRSSARWYQFVERSIRGFGNTRVVRHVRGGGR